MQSDAERRMQLGGAKKEGRVMIGSIIFHLIIWVAFPLYLAITHPY